MTVHDSVTLLAGIGPKKAAELAEMEIHTLEDLLHHIPFRYEDASAVIPIAKLEVGELVTVEAQITQLKSFTTRKRIPMTQATIADAEGDELSITFFHQPYVAKQLKQDEWYAFTGKVGEYRGKKSLTNPNYEPLDRENKVHTGRVLPQYSQHKSISSVWLRRVVPKLVEQTALLPEEYLPASLRTQAELPERTSAWQQVHVPESLAAAHAARRRIAFDELWDIFTAIEAEREHRESLPVRNPLSKAHAEEFTAQFVTASPFPLTPSQNNTIAHLKHAFLQNHPVQQFIQGEVGSGKTLVAAYALFLQASLGNQCVYLVPTTVLAEQHYQNLEPIASALGISLGRWTGTQKESEPVSVLVGTHALLHNTAISPDLIVVDEEHRFGVDQREHHWDEGLHPHRITMTATPIPRTLAHVVYGNHSVSFLDPIPGKKRAITTRVFAPSKLDAHFTWLEQQITETGTQAFLIAPLIEPSETDTFADVYDATTLCKRVKKALPNMRVALVTGRTPSAEKQSILSDMQSKKIDILVATPVIEVGIDIPNASIISILSAERFGFAQLHQLRGRVGRSGQAGWAFLVPTPGKTADRLRILETTDNGQELAELDLQNRGVGEFLGRKQTGWDGLRVATWMDLELIELVKSLSGQFQKMSS